MLAQHLGISSSDIVGCQDDLQVNVDHPHLEQGENTSVLRVECGYKLYLVLFGQEPGKSWRKLDTLPLYDAYNRVKLTYQCLIGPGVQELVIDNAATVSGNLYEAYFLVIGVVHGHFKTGLAVLESSMEPHFGGEARNEKSVFTIQPATASETGEINQVAHLTIGTHTFLIHSSYSYISGLDAFAMDEANDISRTK